MSTSGVPLQSAQNPAQQPDEDLLAMLGLHPQQIDLAKALHTGAVHPQTVIDAVTPKAPAPDAVAAQPNAPPPLIAAPGPANAPAVAPPVVPFAGKEETPPATAPPKALIAPPMDSSAIVAPPRPPGAQLSTNVTPPSKFTQDQSELERLDKTGSGISQFQQRHPIVGTIARIGAGVGSALFPTIAASIPGTDLHHQQLVGQARGRVAQDLGEEKEQAATGKERADTNEANARAQSLTHPQAKEGVTDEEKTFSSLIGQVNPATGKPYTALEAFREVKQAAQDVKPDKTVEGKTLTRVVNGVPHTILIKGDTGEDIKDEGQTKVPGESSADKRSAQESAQVEREARLNIRKAEGTYRDTQKSVGQLKASIDASKDGNGLLTSFVPTMEVLGINAASGVHRISPAEAQAANLPGGWAERFNAWFDKAATGKLSPQLQQEGKQLADILSKSAHDRYKATYDDESSIVSGYGGKDFNKRVPMIQDEGAGGGAGVQYTPGMIRNGYKFKGGDPTQQSSWEKQ